MTHDGETAALRQHRDIDPTEHGFDGRESGLAYPCGEPPEQGHLVGIAPGVDWVRMPGPGSLGHINVWALEDGAGIAVVDTGLCNDSAASSWSQVLAGPLGAKSLTRVIATHMHPDHIGMAGWLVDKFGCRLWMTQLEYLHCRTLVSDTGRAAPADAVAFYRQAGWGEAAIDVYRSRFGNFGRLISPLPDSYRRVEDGEILHIGRQDWEVIVGGGHTPEHACLYCPTLKLFISGDQVLPRISSNVSVHPTEPDADPLSDWLASIEKIRARVPPDVMVLPAHNEPFVGLHRRLDALATRQRDALYRLLQFLQTPRRVVDVFGTLFSRPIPLQDHMLLGLATGESLAHLNYLVRRRAAVVEIDPDGIAWYRRSGS